MSAIKVGDLVRVHKTCCGRYVGWIFVVERIGSNHGRDAQCSECGHYEKRPIYAFSKDAIGKFKKCQLKWLKRIPPLSELEGEKRKEELTA